MRLLVPPLAMAVVMAAGVAMTGCSGGGNGDTTISAASTTSPPVASATSSSISPPAIARVALSDLEPVGNESPSVDPASVDGKNIGQAVYIGPCGNYDETIYEYRVPPRSAIFSTTVAVGDRSQADSEVQVEFFVDGGRAVVTTPRLGAPNDIVIDIAAAGVLSIRASAVKTESCGDSRGVVLTKAEFSSVQNSAAVKPLDGRSEYVVEAREVSSDCRSFYYHSDSGPMRLDGQVRHHTLSAGRDPGIGDDEPGPCVFEYDLGRSAKRIVAVAGVGDASDTAFTCRVELSVDGKPTQTLDLALGKTVPVDISVVNALRLRVVFTFLEVGYGECALGDFRIMR
ncbi:hypothetical protein ACWIGW_15650 [Nocardia brasiliensis]